jgi:hypothetical protein
MIDPHNPTVGARVPRVVDPWPEDEPARAAEGISLGVLLAAALWLAAFGVLIWAWAS